uniref:Frizzled-4 n=1 Tax=Steinernema glaseri TaxID=37863 RepID=A0A1I7XYZ0_9BILA
MCWSAYVRLFLPTSSARSETQLSVSETRLGFLRLKSFARHSFTPTADRLVSPRAPSTMSRAPASAGFLLLLLLLMLPAGSTSFFDQATQPKCRKIQLEMCQDMPYKSTIYPNKFLPIDEQDVTDIAEYYKVLIKTGCHPHVKLFVCSAFAPMCSDTVPKGVTSCRSVCEEVRRGCVTIVQTFGVKWPEMLNCSRFPEHPEVCIDPKLTKGGTFEHEQYELPSRIGNPGQMIYGGEGVRESFVFGHLPSCPKDMINLDPTDRNGTCAARCNADIMFTKVKKETATFWMLTLAFLNAVVTGLTVLTFLIDSARFRFPERTVCYVAACYFFYSLPFLSRFFLSVDRTACSNTPSMASYLIHSGLDNTACVASFVVSYFFSMAGSLWWIMLAFTWFLSAGRKWVPEGIDACRSYLHLFAWGVPMLLTLAVLVTHKVDASELLGLCGVGNTDPWMLLGFHIIPRLLFVVVGSCLIVAGFSSMCREREAFRRRGTDTSKLDKLMVKMGLFSALYIIPSIILVICDVYHMAVLFQWYPHTIGCKAQGGADRGYCNRPVHPQWDLYMLNLVMTFVIGSSTGLWVLSSKTFFSWQRFLCCGLCSPPPPTKLQPNAVGQGHPLIPVGNPPPHPPNGHYLPLSVATSVPSAQQHSLYPSKVV